MAASARSLYIGVDGGGTRSRARLRDADGRLFGEGDAGPAGNARLGEEAFAEALNACRKALTAEGLDEAGLARIHARLGLAGIAQAADRAYILRPADAMDGAIRMARRAAQGTPVLATRP